MNVVEHLEQQELMQKLIDNGFGEMVEKILLNEGQSFTRSSRSNKSGMCRVLNWKSKQLEEAFAKCREILREDMAID